MVALSTLFLLVIGLVMVYSSSSITSYVEAGDSLSEAVKQCLFAVVGLIVAVGIVAFVKQDFLRGTGGLVFWGVCVVLLLLTSLLGTVGLGAKRWLIIGPVSIQISEFAKIAFVIMAARIAEDYGSGATDFAGALKQAAVFVVIPLLILFVTQSDLGTTLICCVALIAVVWLAGMSNRTLLMVLGAVAVLGVLAIALKSYRADRLSFLDPWSDMDNTGYQLVHSFKALAAGGLFGVGVGNSYEKLLYLPEAETDFIFAIIGEELGFLGAMAVIAAFLVFLRGGLLISSQASTPFGSLVAAGLTTMLVFQAFLNICCVTGLLPTTGKPLPFISSGGSSLLSSLVLVGVILSISFDSHNEGEYRQRRDNLHVVSSSAQGAVPRRPRSEMELRAPEGRSRAGARLAGQARTARSGGGRGSAGSARASTQGLGRAPAARGAFRVVRAEDIGPSYGNEARSARALRR